MYSYDVKLFYLHCTDLFVNDFTSPVVTVVVHVMSSCTGKEEELARVSVYSYQGGHISVYSWFEAHLFTVALKLNFRMWGMTEMANFFNQLTVCICACPLTPCVQRHGFKGINQCTSSFYLM